MLTNHGAQDGALPCCLAIFLANVSLIFFDFCWIVSMSLSFFFKIIYSTCSASRTTAGRVVTCRFFTRRLIIIPGQQGPVTSGLRVILSRSKHHWPYKCRNKILKNQRDSIRFNKKK